MHYVYVLKDGHGKRYVGYSKNLKDRIYAHERKSAKTTKTYQEPKLVWYCAFTNKTKALNFEKYLKKGSGHAFMNKRLV